VSWIEDIQNYCNKLNIEASDLYSVLSDSKVSPMIRGKAFEFSMAYRLEDILPKDKWEVSKPNMNAQAGLHDVDVMVRHIESGKVISVECKLAKKGGFGQARINGKNYSKKDFLIGVKCMRSRTTLSVDRVKSGAAAYGVTAESFAIHSDQYRPSNFDVVATSIANGFYETDEETGEYIFQPTQTALDFLSKFNPPAGAEALQLFVYNQIYLARSSDLIVSSATGIKCTRRSCEHKEDCGYIPNYPIINFGDVDTLQAGQIPSPKSGWYSLQMADQLFSSFIQN
jgi:hypothetical protein